MGLATTLTAIGLGMASVAAPSAVETSGGVVTRVVSSETWTMGFWASRSFTLSCPPEAPNWTYDEYNPGSGFRIPRGVEVSFSGWGIDAHAVGVQPSSGAFELRGSVTNWSVEERTATVRLHCTSADQGAPPMWPDLIGL